MATINGITSTPATPVKALAGALALDTVWTALAEKGDTFGVSDLADLQAYLEEHGRDLDLMSEDEFEAEVSMSMSVWFTKLGVLRISMERAAA